MGRLGRDGRNLKPKDRTLSSALVSCPELRLTTESNLYCIALVMVGTLVMRVS